MVQNVKTELDGRTLTIETGKVANQANGAVLVTFGDTVLLATATMSKKPREAADFFPLTCDYEERKYAVGKIPGGFVKRGGRPSDKAVLTSRLIDRPIRPLFPDGLRHEVQVVTMPLSMEPANPSDALAILAASAALTVSDIPFQGPIGAVRVCRIEGEFVINPSLEQIGVSDFEMMLAATKDRVMTIEVEAKQVSEDVVAAAMDFAFPVIGEMVRIQEDLAEMVGTVKAVVPVHEVDEEVLSAVRAGAGTEIAQAIKQPDKIARHDAMAELEEQIVSRLAEQFPDREKELGEAIDKVLKEEVRKLVLNESVRTDGRKLDEIRPLSCDVAMLPRVHGSALFTRGRTQVLTALTLGSMDESQKIDNLEEDGEKRFMHFYNFPPYSVGETRPMRAPGRREVGHGALAEKALRAVIPSDVDFPYTMILTSEVLESSGSTSMASACACTLALMDAGVQITAPVAGISIGMMTAGDKYALLTDIADLEDFKGDMDFKVAGTREGVTAIQMDTKTNGLSMQIVRETLEAAKVARHKILDTMEQAIAQPRESLSQYAPRVFVVIIHPDKIGDIIGPGGKIIKKIEADTGAKLDIEQDGRVFITCVEAEGGERAKKMVEDLTREVSVGETYLGRVTRVERYGCFVEILPGREGLVHISELASRRVERVEDVVRLGDEVMVKILPFEDEGKIKLTIKGISEPSSGPPEDRQRYDRGGGPPRGDGPRDDRRPDSVSARFRPKQSR
ncbi:MAG: polyribonucleotide nucleotidyltransferase [Armatimonadota bacterium]|nr:polyribonucleotide nucleotidyltransferase [Armatimonadota bacterium]